MRRRSSPGILALAAVLLLSTAASAQQRRREPDWETIKTRHYEIKYSCTAAEAQVLGQWMEFVYGAYSFLTKARAEKRHVIKLFKDRKEWVAYGQPPGAGAYYTLQTKQLVGYFDRRAAFPFLAHEGLHQFMHIVVPDMPTRIPTWFSEGLADCMGSSTVVKGQFRWCLFDVLIAKGRCFVIKKALREDTALPLDELFRLDHVQFMKNASLHYAQSWSFVHFLFCCPEVEIRHKVIPNGDFKPALVVYFDRLRKGDDHDTAWTKALEKIGKTHEEVEAAWKAYVLDVLPEVGPQDDDAYLGVRTQESRTGGMDVVSVVEGGPAEEGGIRVGDCITHIGGTRLKGQESFTAELKERKPGDVVEVVVMRDRKRVTLEVTLGRRGDYSADPDGGKEKPEKKD